MVFSKITEPFSTKFYMLSFGYKEMKISFHDAGHMTKTAAMSIYGIILKNLVSRKQWADFIGTWYEHQR